MGQPSVKLGLCECDAKVCVLCYKEETDDVHDCPDFDPDRQGNTSVDDATLELLKKIGKKCPGCGMFIEKNAGCHIMNCGANAVSTPTYPLYVVSVVPDLLKQIACNVCTRHSGA